MSVSLMFGRIIEVDLIFYSIVIFQNVLFKTKTVKKNEIES